MRVVYLILVSMMLSVSVSAYYDGNINDGSGGTRGDSYGGARIG